MHTKRIDFPPSTFGIWEVTTEGDCEGRTTLNLGIHEGFIDEIAFKLADQVGYKLRFTWVDAKRVNEMHAVTTEVHISLAIAEIFGHFLNGRDVEVEDGQFYASVKLLAGANAESRAKRVLDIKRAAALAKLTDQDKEVLGLK